MATGDLIFGDSFQHYQTDVGELSSKWTAAGVMATAQVGPSLSMFDVVRDQVLHASGNGVNYWAKVLAANYAAGTLGTYFRTGSFTQVSTIISALDAGAVQLDVRYTTGGLITVTRNGTVLFTSTNALAINTPYHIEFLFTIDQTTGTYEVKVDGSSVGWVPQQTAADTANTANEYFNEIRVHGFDDNGSGSGNHRYSHLYLLEGLNSVGPSVGRIMAPVGAGTNAAWTPNYASNWANVVSADGDYTFNQSATAAQQDSHSLTDAPSNTVHGVQAVLQVRQDAGSGHTVRAFLRIAGTNYFGAAKATGATYGMLLWVWTLNPATAAAWTTADLAGVELGYEFVS